VYYSVIIDQANAEAGWWAGAFLAPGKKSWRLENETVAGSGWAAKSAFGIVLREYFNKDVVRSVRP
jgi:hypothetical protein